jgi:large subunit ribosomal protein L10
MSDVEASHKTANVPEWKREEVDELVEFAESYDAVGVVDLTGIPSRQLQDMRRELHGQAALRMSRNTLTVRALEQVGGGLEDLTDEMSGHVGLIGTDDNPFGLYQQLEASKTSAPIGAGEVAPNEIVIPEGDTGVDPGPFVGELQQVGAEARIQDGSIHVLSDSVVAEAGDEVSGELANVLGELGIEPKEVGLDLRAVVADGVLFDPADLAIDVEEYREDVEAAAASARNLSINAAFPTPRTTETLVATAATEARSLGLSAAVATPDLADDLIAAADANLRALAAEVDDEEALPEELRDVDAPATDEVVEETDDAAETDEDPEEDEQADEDDDEDDDTDDGAAGLGNMFGD